MHSIATVILFMLQIFGARPARSNTGMVSTSSGEAPDGVSSTAWRSASVLVSKPSVVSLAPLPASWRCGGTCLPALASLAGFGRALGHPWLEHQSRPDHEGS